jgi:hypothetical protein
MALRQGSFFCPATAAIDDGDTTPNPGTVNAIALSTVTMGLMRWTGAAWTALHAAPRAMQVDLDFGHAAGGESTTATATVTAAWVTASSPISCTPAGLETEDHGSEDASLEELTVYATNRVPGVGFDITGTAPNGTWGRHRITATG